MARYFLAAVAAAIPYSSALAQTANDIMTKAVEIRSAALAGVENLTYDQSTGGVRNFLYQEVRVVETPEGPMFMLVPMSLYDPSNPAGGPGTPAMSPSDLRLFGAASMATGMVLSDEIKAQNPFPVGIDDLEQMKSDMGEGDQVWTSVDPAVLMMGNAMFLEGAATAMEQNAREAANADADAGKQATELRSFAEVAELVGEDTIDGRSAYHLRAPVNRTERQDGREFTMQTMSVWIDKETYAQLKTEMGGVVSEDGKSQPMSIERQSSDIRKVPGTDLYEPYHSVMRIGGMMNAEQQAQMREAQKQMAQFEQQLKEMPAAQRDMIMRQMGPQMEQMKKMASGGGFEVETVVHEIKVNAGRPKPMEVASKTFGAPVAASPAPQQDQVEVRPYYVDDKGVGLLRYSRQDEEPDDYFLVINGLSDGPRPREVLVGAMGPYSGPDVAIYIGSLSMLNVPLDRIELELYQDNPYRPTVRFRPAVNAALAEGMGDCGTMSAGGACSNTRPVN